MSWIRRKDFHVITGLNKSKQIPALTANTTDFLSSFLWAKQSENSLIVQINASKRFTSITATTGRFKYDILPEKMREFMSARSVQSYALSDSRALAIGQ